MTLVYGWRNGTTDPLEIIDGRFRLGTLSCTVNAEEGSVGSWTLIADDPDGDFDIIPHRVFAIWETEAPVGEQVIAVGYVQRRRVHHGEESNLVGVSRVWDIDIFDLNCVLGRRVMTGSDCKRPAETDVARMQWAILTNEAGLIDDDTYLSTASPKDMDACDYTGQTLMDIIEDCAGASGKNYFLWWNEALRDATHPYGGYSIFYDFPESAVWSSTIRLSSDPALYDDVSDTAEVLPCSAVLELDPARITSGSYLPYDGGYVYVQDATTAAQYARIDRVFPSINVKSKATATTRANRLIADLTDDDERLSLVFETTAAQVNAVKAGMRVSVNFPHLPGYSSNRWVRILNRTVEDIGIDRYRITCDASGSPQSVDDTDYGEGPPPDPGDPFILGVLTTDISSGPGNNSLAEFGDDGTGPGTLYLYTDCSYRFDFAVTHAHQAPALYSNYLKTQCDPSQTPVFNMGAVRLGTAITGQTYVSTPAPGALHELQRTWVVLAHTAYVNCNGIGSNVSCTITYVSGPDERFV